jgi:translation initiation factor IF-1
MYKINDQVLFNGVQAKITAILSDKRYQVYTQNGEVKLAKEKELERL